MKTNTTRHAGTNRFTFMLNPFLLFAQITDRASRQQSKHNAERRATTKMVLRRFEWMLAIALRADRSQAEGLNHRSRGQRPRSKCPKVNIAPKGQTKCSALAYANEFECPFRVK